VFVENNGVNRFDVLGLECDCGPDITEALRATLKEVDTEFGTLDIVGKISACAAVAGFGADVANAWDINTLAYTSPNYPKDQTGYTDPLEKGYHSHCCSYPCRDTVVIEGKCVSSHQATYVLLGKIAALCSTPIGYVHPIIDDWKRRRYPGAPRTYTDQAHALTDYGFGGAWPADFDGLGSECFVKAGYRTAMKKFEWTWEPFHPRRH